MFTELAGGDIQPLPVLMDVDTGIDDAVAIALAATDPRLDLVAVTCVAGNTALPDVVTNSRTVLELAGRSDIPVAAGADRPLVCPPIGTSNAWVPGGSGVVTPRWSAILPRRFASTPLRSLSGRPASVLASSRWSPQSLSQTSPSLCGWSLTFRVCCVVGYSWAAHSRFLGTRTPYGEFNVVADPHAASIAIEAFGAADTRSVGVGLDVTHQVRLLPEHIEELARRLGDTWSVRPDVGSWGTSSQPLLSFLEGAMHKYCEYHYAFHGFYGIYIHDAVTILATLVPELLVTRAVAV